MHFPESATETPAGLKACHQLVHPLLAVIATVCLLAFVGWTGMITAWQHWFTTGAGLAFVLERAWQFQRGGLGPAGDRRFVFHAVLALAVLGASVVLLLQPRQGPDWRIGAHVFIQLAVMISGLAAMVRHQARFTARAIHPGQVLVLSFFAIIVVGTLLLKMPRCTASGESCSWLVAAFTSTSAVCVTGLTVENTATFFSPTGQGVILLLIQVGGLGIMTLAFFAAVVLFESISLHDRLLLGRMIQENRLARIGRTLAFIVVMTFVCEAIGAVVLFAGMDAIADLGDRGFQAIFHAVSAFCNAGFSTLPDGMASPVVFGNGVWQVCIMVLVVIGGLGALVNEDITLWTMAKIRRRVRKEGPDPRLRVHTRLVLAVTAVLILSGALLFYLTEFSLWQGPENNGRLLTAFFHSVTTRTAGFNTVPMGGVGPLTVQLMMILMLIGGSPGGTAGGLRTTTVAVGLGHLWDQLRSGKRGMVAFNRTIPPETGARALGLMVLAGIWLAANFILLQVLQAGSGIPESTLLFELISSFATVGLSLDLTASLTDGAKCLIILNMFVGRIGLLTVVATFVRPDSRPPSGKPREDILLT